MLDSKFKLIIRKQALAAKELQSLSKSITKGQNMTRLQCRSFPLGVRVIIDGISRGVTPITVEDLEPGEHEVQMQFTEPDGSITSKMERVVVKKGKRVVCKLYFKEPKTLA